MNVLYLLIPISIVLIAFAVWAFMWAVGSGQFDDLDSPGWRILMDDDEKPPPRTGESRSPDAPDNRPEHTPDDAPRNESEDEKNVR